MFVWSPVSGSRGQGASSASYKEVRCTIVKLNKRNQCTIGIDNLWKQKERKEANRNKGQAINLNLLDNLID